VRLVASDLDGTLLLPDKSLSPRTVRVLRELVEAGVVLVLVSGRPPRTLREVAQALKLKGLAICCNGALVYDLDGASIVQHWPCPPEIIQVLVRQLREAAPGVSFAVEQGLTFGCESGYAAWYPPVWSGTPEVADVLELLTEPVTKVIVRHPTIHRDEMLTLIQSLGGDAILATHSGAPFVEVSAGGIGKAAALAWLAASLGIDRQDVVAFGDMPNDLAMLEWAGRGVAVANAHPTVLAAADEVTLAHTEDGVAIALERMLRHRRDGGDGDTIPLSSRTERACDTIPLSSRAEPNGA
jgi:Cof subfamily protein (haloacid dehalogenase superfamily)